MNEFETAEIAGEILVRDVVAEQHIPNVYGKDPKTYTVEMVGWKAV